MPRQPVLQDYGNIQMPQSDNSYQLETMRNIQRDKEHKRELDYGKQQAKAKDGKDATDFIGGLKIDHIGDNTIDLYNDAQIVGLQKELNGMQAKGATVQEIKLAAMQKLPKIAQGYTIAKNEYGKITDGIKDLTKDYPTGDMAAARNIAGKEMLKTIFEFDEKGQVKGYKDPSLVPSDKNYLADLTNNQNLSKWYRNSGSFEKGIKDLPLTPIKGGTTRTDKYGRKVKQTFTGHGSVFDEPIMNEEGEQTGWKLKSETVPLGRNEDGSVILKEVMPKEQFEMALSTPAAKLDFESDFNKYLEQTGVNPDKLDPRAKDVLARGYAFDLFNKTGIHGSSFLPTDEIKEAPIKNITNNNIKVNTGKDVDVNDLYSRVEKAADKHYPNGVPLNELNTDEQGIVLDFANKGAGDTPYTRADIFVKKEESGKVNVYKVAGIDANGKQIINFDAANKIGTLPRVGTNLKVQANVDGKKEVVRQGDKKVTPKKETPTQTVKVPGL